MGVPLAEEDGWLVTLYRNRELAFRIPGRAFYFNQKRIILESF
jgi:hypothetical protein